MDRLQILDASRLTTMNNRALVEAFEKAGVEFIPENGGGAGLRMRKPAGEASVRDQDQE